MCGEFPGCSIFIQWVVDADFVRSLGLNRSESGRWFGFVLRFIDLSGFQFVGDVAVR